MQQAPLFPAPPTHLLRDRLMAVRNADLKKILQAHNLRLTGKKSELVERILTAVDPYAVASYVEATAPPTIISPSPLQDNSSNNFGMAQGMAVPGISACGMQPSMVPGMAPTSAPALAPTLAPGIASGIAPGIASGIVPGIVPGMVLGMAPKSHHAAAPPLTAPSNRGKRATPSTNTSSATSAKKKKIYPNLPDCICKGNPTSLSLTNSEPSDNAAPESISCASCKVLFHRVCLGSSEFCTKCLFSDLDPFHKLVWPLHVVRLKRNSTSSEYTMKVDSPNLHDLRKKHFEVILYCIQTDRVQPPNNSHNNTSDSIESHLRQTQIHQWPSSITIRIRQHEETVNKPDEQHVRRDLPIRLTQYLTAESTNVFKVNADTSNSNSSNFICALCLTTTESVNSLMRECNNKGSLDSTIKLSRLFFFGNTQPESSSPLSSPSSGEKESEIELINSRCISKLNCPLTLTRMQVPVRGASCKHLQCFDLESFLSVNFSSRAFSTRWKCPECTSFLRPSDLITDQVTSQAIIDNPEAEEIEFFQDGTYKFLRPEPPAAAARADLQQKEEETDDDDEEPPPQPTAILDISDTDDDGDENGDNNDDVDDDDDDDDDDDIESNNEILEGPGKANNVKYADVVDDNAAGGSPLTPLASSSASASSSQQYQRQPQENIWDGPYNIDFWGSSFGAGLQQQQPPNNQIPPPPPPPSSQFLGSNNSLQLPRQPHPGFIL